VLGLLFLLPCIDILSCDVALLRVRLDPIARLRSGTTYVGLDAVATRLVYLRWHTIRIICGRRSVIRRASRRIIVGLGAHELITRPPLLPAAATDSNSNQYKEKRACTCDATLLQQNQKSGSQTSRLGEPAVQRCAHIDDNET
jgi:hypothetical protein